MSLVGDIRILFQVIKTLSDPVVWMVIVLDIPLAVVIPFFPERHGDNGSTCLDWVGAEGTLGPALAPGHTDVGNHSGLHPSL